MVIITVKPSDIYLLNVIKSVHCLDNNICYENIKCQDFNGRFHIWQRPFLETYSIPTIISENDMPLPYLLTGFQQGTSPSVIWEYITNIVKVPCVCCNN
jgi:hypothetical protein